MTATEHTEHPDAVDREAVAAFLGTTTLFRKLAPEERADLAALVERRTVTAGAVIAVRRTRSDYLYFIERGTVRLHEPHTDIPIELATVSDGGAIGASALVEPYLYSANATATTDTVLLRIPAAQLVAYLDSHPQAGMYVMTAVAAQVRGLLDSVIALWAEAYTT